MPSQVVGVAELLPAIRGIHSLSAGRLVVGPHARGTTSRSRCPVRYCRLHRRRTFHATGPCRPQASTRRTTARRILASRPCFHEAGERRPGQLPGGRITLAGSASCAHGRHGNGEAQYDPSHFPAVPSRAENRVGRDYMTGGKLQGQVVNSPVFAQKALRSGKAWNFTAPPSGPHALQT